MQTVLITGASGFIGRHCVTFARERFQEVHAPSRSVRSLEGIVFHDLNLMDAVSVEKLLAAVRPSHLLHLAWIAEPGVYWTSPENIRWVEASLHLLRGFAKHGGRRAVLIGSCAEYDWRYGYCSEAVTPLRPATLYGTAKHCFRELAESFAHAVGLSLAWARLFFLYGPYEHPKRLVASVINSLLLGQPALCSAGLHRRDFLHTLDAAEALVTLLKSEVVGPINVASGVPVSVSEIATTIASLLDRRELLRLGSLPSPQEVPLLAADVRRLQTELGWTPRFTLEQGLNQTIEWWRSVGRSEVRVA